MRLKFMYQWIGLKPGLNILTMKYATEIPPPLPWIIQVPWTNLRPLAWQAWDHASCIWRFGYIVFPDH